MPCTCRPGEHRPRLVVLTGGPGGGKTAVLEVVRRRLCEHLAVLPEAASILWSGGFPRRPSRAGREAAQRAISRVQIELEKMALAEGDPALVLCDRGTVDGLAYWPGPEADFFAGLGTSRERELARYATVIHLRPPPDGDGYDHTPLRVESAREAAAIDERIARAWDGHPRRFFVESSHDFLAKLARAIDLVRNELPACCRGAAPDGPAIVNGHGAAPAGG